MSTISQIKLPDTEWELIRVAVRDARACLADEKYKLYIDGEAWHAMKYGKCQICLAGAVLAKSLMLPYGSAVAWGMIEDSGNDIAKKLAFINDARAFRYMSKARLTLEMLDGRIIRAPIDPKWVRSTYCYNDLDPSLVENTLNAMLGLADWLEEESRKVAV